MPSSPLHAYPQRTRADNVDAGFLAYLAALTEIACSSPETAASIVRELADRRSNLRLIDGEECSSLATQLAMGSLFTDKYAEGHAKHLFHAGCDNVDAVETLPYVQPHSGADANLVAFWSVICARVEVPAQILEAHTYTVDGLLDYDAIEAQAGEVKPLILAGYGA